MNQKYYTLLTTKGAALLANATALGSQLKLTQMAVGDGNGTIPQPVATQTKLVHEVRRAPINTLFIDKNNANQIVAEQVIPESEGGWFIHEIGLYDDKGNLIAVGNCPSTYKPKLVEGSGRTQVIRMIIIIDNTDALQIKIDPSVVLATREYVDDLILAKMAEHEKSINHPNATTESKGFVQLSSLTNSESEALAATPKAVKTTYDLAAGAVKKSGDTMTGSLIISSPDSAELTIQGSNKKDILSIWANHENGNVAYIHQKTDGGNAIARFTKASGIFNFENFDNVTVNSKSILKQGDFGLLVSSQSVTQITTIDQLAAMKNGERLFVRTSDTTILPVITHGYLLKNGVRDNSGGGSFIFSEYVENGSIWKGTQLTSSSNVVWQKVITDANVNNFLPIGIPQPWPTTTLPAGWLKCNGSAFDKTKYPKLASVYLDGKLPDLRGEFIRGVDDGRGVDSGRGILSGQGDAIRNITGEVTGMQDYSSGAFSKIHSAASYARLTDPVQDRAVYAFDASRVVPTANENRPRNVAFLYIVKAE